MGPLWVPFMGPLRMYTYIFKGDTMLEKIKNFVKSVSSTTWIVVAVGVFALVVLTWVSSHAKAPAAAPAAVEAPATK